MNRLKKVVIAFGIYEVAVSLRLMPLGDDRSVLEGGIRYSEKFERKYGSEPHLYYNFGYLSLPEARLLLKETETKIAFWERLSPPHKALGWLLGETRNYTSHGVE